MMLSATASSSQSQFVQNSPLWLANVRCRPLSAKDDIATSYNEELAQRPPLTWLNSPWMFTECFMFK
jgi:hypothetical protein